MYITSIKTDFICRLEDKFSPHPESLGSNLIVESEELTLKRDSKKNSLAKMEKALETLNNIS